MKELRLREIIDAAREETDAINAFLAEHNHKETEEEKQRWIVRYRNRQLRLINTEFINPTVH